MIRVLIVLGMLMWAGCAQQEEIQEKPKVTYNSDGSVHIDRLDPGESVEIDVPRVIESLQPVEDYMWIVLDTTALISRIKQQVLDSISEVTDE